MHSLHFFYVKRNVYSLNIGVFSCLCQLMVHDDAVCMSYQAREVTSNPVTALTCSDVRPKADTSLLLPLRPLALGSLGCYNVCQIFLQHFSCLWPRKWWNSFRTDINPCTFVNIQIAFTSTENTTFSVA